MKRSSYLLANAALLLSLLLLTACGKKAATPGPEAVYTSAAETVQAQLQTQGLPTSAPTTTPFVFNTNTPAVVPPASGATLPPVAQPTLPAGATNTPNVPDRAVWVSQTPADDSSIVVGAPFTMTWTVRNTGATTWKTNYQLRYWAGDKMGSPASANLSKEVAPNEQVDITLNLTAPRDPGSYHGIWVLTTAEGVNFYPLDVTVKVIPTPTNTPAPTETATETPAPAAPTATTESSGS